MNEEEVIKAICKKCELIMELLKFEEEDGWKWYYFECKNCGDLKVVGEVTEKQLSAWQDFGVYVDWIIRKKQKII